MTQTIFSTQVHTYYINWLIIYVKEKTKQLKRTLKLRAIYSNLIGNSQILNVSKIKGSQQNFTDIKIVLIQKALKNLKKN
jgi:hypothetical protein